MFHVFQFIENITIKSYCINTPPVFELGKLSLSIPSLYLLFALRLVSRAIIVSTQKASTNLMGWHEQVSYVQVSHRSSPTELECGFHAYKLFIYVSLPYLSLDFCAFLNKLICNDGIVSTFCF